MKMNKTLLLPLFDNKMKKIYLLATMIICFIGLSSCEKAILNDFDKSDVKSRDTCMVSFNVNEEFINVSDMPMTRVDASEGKFYAINIYEKKPGVKSYTKYAYGLFTDPSQMKIVLTKGNVYRFECLVVTNAEDAVYNEDGEFFAPFLHGSKDNLPTKAENKFIKSTSINLSNIQEGRTRISTTKTVLYPRMYKSYGVLENFDPSSSQKVALQTKRAVFGLHLIITPPSEGKLNITYLYNTLTLNPTDPIYDHSSIYSFNRIDLASIDGYHGEFKFLLTWEKEDGTILQAEKVVDLKRNVNTKVKVNVKEPESSVVEIVEENEDMGEDAITWTVED